MWVFNPFTGTLDWTGAGSAPSTPSSLRSTRTAATALSGHRAVTPKADGELEYADPADIGNRPVWITTGAIDADDTGTVVEWGDLSEGSWSWLPGNIYLGPAGTLTQEEPEEGALVVVASASAPTALFVNRQPTIDL